MQRLHMLGKDKQTTTQQPGPPVQLSGCQNPGAPQRCQGDGLVMDTALALCPAHQQAPQQQVPVPGSALATPWLPTHPHLPVQPTPAQGGPQWRQAPCTW
jgi:hypothetical protein